MNGISFASGTKPKTLMTPYSPEEKNTVEGPWVLLKDTTYYLFFSADGFLSPRYYVCVARSQNVTRPYQRWHQNVLELDDARFKAGKVTFVGPGSTKIFSFLTFHSQHLPL